MPRGSLVARPLAHPSAVVAIDLHALRLVLVDDKVIVIIDILFLVIVRDRDVVHVVVAS